LVEKRAQIAQINDLYKHEAKMHKLAGITPLILLAGISGQVTAHEFDTGNAYGGVGLTFNTIGTGNATGFQVFGGYDLNVKINGDISTAVEVGYMDSGNFNAFGAGSFGGAEGIWVALVPSVEINNKMDAFTRVGIDLGDDDGLLVGAGMGYHFNKNAELRVEYVVRDNINGMQFNAVFHL
jgi:hypothetical protein